MGEQKLDQLPETVEDGPGPPAFGKYRGLVGSSAEYAEFKQGEIDREDRRSVPLCGRDDDCPSREDA